MGQKQQFVAYVACLSQIASLRVVTQHAGLIVIHHHHHHRGPMGFGQMSGSRWQHRSALGPPLTEGKLPEAPLQALPLPRIEVPPTAAELKTLRRRQWQNELSTIPTMDSSPRTLEQLRWKQPMEENPVYKLPKPLRKLIRPDPTSEERWFINLGPDHTISDRKPRFTVSIRICGPLDSVDTVLTRLWAAITACQIHNKGEHANLISRTITKIEGWQKVWNCENLIRYLEAEASP